MVFQKNRIFAAQLTPKIQPKMFTQRINNQSLTGGGSKLQHKLTFVTAYIRRYWKVKPSALPQQKRTYVVSYLCLVCGLTQAQVAQYLRTSLRTVQRDCSTAKLLTEKSLNFRTQVHCLKSYVDYYQNYCER